MKLKPMHDWAVIVPSEAEARTAGGLYIPETAKEKPEEGVVEAIGPGAYEEEKGKKKEEKKERKFIPTTVKPGDRVLYERYAGQTYKIDTEERILVRERDILGWIERTLQIPSVTTARSITDIMRRPVSFPPMKAPVAKAAKKKAKKTAAKASVNKSSKKTAAKKAAKKSVKKAAKKAVSKSKKTSKTKGKKAGKKK